LLPAALLMAPGQARLGVEHPSGAAGRESARPQLQQGSTSRRLLLRWRRCCSGRSCCCNGRRLDQRASSNRGSTSSIRSSSSRRPVASLASCCRQLCLPLSASSWQLHCTGLQPRRRLQQQLRQQPQEAGRSSHKESRQAGLGGRLRPAALCCSQHQMGNSRRQPQAATKARLIAAHCHKTA